MPILANALIATARPAYSAATGLTGAPTAYLSGVRAAINETASSVAEHYTIPPAGVLSAEYEAAVDSGTDVAVDDLITSLVLLSDGVTAWPGTAPLLVVNTTGSAVSATGAQTVTPASMTGIVAGSLLACDTGAKAESVIVSAVTSTTFTAFFTQTHAASFVITVSNVYWRVTYGRETAPGFLPERLLYLTRVTVGGPAHP